MKTLFFYYDERYLNDETSYYVKIVERSFKATGYEMNYCTKLGDVKKEDIIFTITSRFFLKAKIKYPNNKTVFWSQGVGPEEYRLRANNMFVFFIKILIEFSAIKY
jgi:hypothetical protein